MAAAGISERLAKTALIEPVSRKSMVLVYQLGFFLVLAIAGPFLLLFKKKSRAGLKEKLGVIPEHISSKHYADKPSSQRPAWFHTVSVGEFNAGFPLLTAFHSQYPDTPLVVTTTTATGQKLAQEKVGSWALVSYFPFDLPFSIKPWLDAVSPNMVVILETEIWPGFAKALKSRNIPLVAVNARMSPRSFASYQRLKWFLAPVLRCYSLLCVQSNSESERFGSLGARQDAIQVTGNLKFDGLVPITEQETAELRKKLGLDISDLVLIAGSTHELEESAMIDLLRKLRQDQQLKLSGDETAESPDSNRAQNGQGRGAGRRLRLILVPRHPERFDRVAQLIESNGFQPKRFSRGESFSSSSEKDILLVDAIGQLSKLYSIGTIAFVGGTIAPIGGHNLLEPYLYRVPVICGQYISKTRDVAQSLQEANAISITSTFDEMYENARTLLSDPVAREKMGRSGELIIMSSKGAVSATLTHLTKLLSKQVN